MSDLLGGALGDHTDGRQLSRLPLSFHRPGVGSWRQWHRRPLNPAEQAHARRMFTAAGVTPHGLARRQRPVTFADVVYRGSTFTTCSLCCGAWMDEQRAHRGRSFGARHVSSE